MSTRQQILELKNGSRPILSGRGMLSLAPPTSARPMCPPLAFPEFPAGKIDGLAIYLKAPEVLAQTDLDTRIYIGTRPGRFVIPAAVKLT